MGQFIVLIILMLVVAFFLRLDFIFYVIYVCIGVYAWSRWYTPRALSRILSYRDYAQHAFWGELVPITVKIRNPNRLPIPWLQVMESVAIQLKRGDPVNRVIALKRNQTAALTYTILGRRRGYYQIGPLKLTTGDLFGIHPEQNAYLPADYLTIYPRLTPLTHLGLPSRLPFGTISSHQRLFEDPARPMGVRDFRSGDSLRQINWKASAHTRKLVVKTFQPAISLETAVLLDLHGPSYRRKRRVDTVEWAIEVAASLAAHLIEQRQAVGLMTNGIDPLAGGGEETQFDEMTGRLIRPTPAAIRANPAAYLPPNIAPRNGRPHLIKILERLARIESDETIPLEQWGSRACLHLSWGVTILAITARGTESVCQTLHRLVRTGFNPVLIALEPDHNFGLVKERGRRLGFAAYNVSRPRDLDPWRRPQQGGVG